MGSDTPRKSSPGKRDGHHSVLSMLRRLFSYLFFILLFIVILPHMCSKVSRQSQKIMERRSIFGDNLIPTPWHWHDNQLGPLNRTRQRQLAILKCSIPRLFHHRPCRAVSIQNDTRECPSYFRWIEKDLAPWKETGITPLHIETAREHSAFKVVILKGRLYVDLYYSCVQTRAVFTVWGLLMLLEKFKGNVPDVVMLFDCMDRPQIQKPEDMSSEFWSPAPLFRYCSNSKHYDIPWPDWSFWGWSETNLEPWDQERSKIVMGSIKKPWRFKSPKAYWRGNPDVGSPMRMQLLQCNSSSKFTGAEIIQQNWTTERAIGKRNSMLESQCEHRYKIYVEGFAWSVSLKYIMACGSATLAISPAYYDFYMRGLEAGVHYTPVRPSEICAPELCGAINRAVSEGEKQPLEALKIGQSGQHFVNNEIAMFNVYDYMFHMVRAYADLQRFKPSKPKRATLVTQEFVLCLAQPKERALLEKSRKHIPYSKAPCHLAATPEKSFNDSAWEVPEAAKELWATPKCNGRTEGKGKLPFINSI